MSDFMSLTPPKIVKKSPYFYQFRIYVMSCCFCFICNLNCE